MSNESIPAKTASPSPQSTPQTAAAPQLDRRITLLLAALTLAMYLRTLAPGLLAGDPGEFQFAAWNFGLAHPTGYPLYMVLGGLWQRLWALIGIPPATSLNAFSAVCAAAAVALLYRLMLDWLPGSLTVRRMAALFSALLLATNPTFWNQSLIAEVYALHALFVVGILWAARAAGNGQASPGLPLFLAILALAHHATSILLLPGLLVYLTLRDRSWWRSWRVVGLGMAGVALVALSYLYIPLRAGADASPWYHQDVGGQVLDLYAGGWNAFVQFISGRSISVGFRGVGEAWAQVGFAASQWRLHFSWPGLALVGMGLVALGMRRNWPVLALTGIFALLQQVFNLFYGIDDIFVYYIPLYLTGAIWAGFGVAGLAGGRQTANAVSKPAEPEPEPERTEPQAGLDSPEQTGRPTVSVGSVLAVLVFLIPMNLARAYLPQIDQSDATGARVRWEEILAAAPPDDALLVSNDRNEIVPLFYLQYVEQRVPGLAGLFPLMAPDARFADVGATVETALRLGDGRPVYLIKPMPGLDVRFQLEPHTPPLYQVTGVSSTAPPQIAVDETLGPLTLLGYDVAESTGTTDTLRVRLHWRVDAPLGSDYTTTVQLFDEAQERVAQSDQQPGGAFYPTSLWKEGETLVEEHLLTLPPNDAPAHLLVGMYHGPTMELLAPPLELPWAESH